MDYAKKIATLFVLFAVAIMQFGCGEDGEGGNSPASKLTSSVVVSQSDSSSHVHTITIPFTDVSETPASATYQYTSSTTNGHSHLVALSKQQMIDANNGMRLILTSSAATSGASHNHKWNVQGGDVLYEKYCYNCHTNDKRGHNPMNVSFNTNQRNAVINPAGAPLSTSPGVIPGTPPGDAPDGAALYTADCAFCHGSLVNSSKHNKIFTQIKAAIAGNVGGMSSLGSLTDAELQAIATALVIK